MKTIYLHIGTPKTGTSALQKFFLDNRIELKNRGISYPKHALGEYDISSGNGQEIINIGLKDGVEKARAYLDKLVGKSDSESVLISTEAFYNHPDLVRQIVPSAKIIVYFRNQLDLVESSYNQAVKRAGQKASFSTALKRVLASKEPFYTGELILKWAELYGVNNIIFRVYEPESFVNGNIYDDFLSALGVSGGGAFAKPKEKVNVSYNIDALVYKRCVNAITEGFVFPYMKEVDDTLQAYSHERFRSGEVKYSLYSGEELKMASEFFSPYCDEIKRVFRFEHDLFKKTYDLSPFEINFDDRLNAIHRITDRLLVREPRMGENLAVCLAKSLRSESPLVQASAMELAPLLSRPEFYEANYSELSGDEVRPCWFSENQLSMMINGKYREPDFLRDIAVQADSRKHARFAHRLIQRALELRPNGPKIIELERAYRAKLLET